MVEVLGILANETIDQNMFTIKFDSIETKFHDQEHSFFFSFFYMSLGHVYHVGVIYSRGNNAIL